MPLKLRDPTPGKTPNYHIRGTYRGIYVERTAGTPDKRKAQAFLKDICEQIERGDYSDESKPAPVAQSEPLEPTFADATLAYLKANGEAHYVRRIINELKAPYTLADKPLSKIDQMLLDSAAAQLYPDSTAQTRNRQFYTPVSAIMKRAGIEMKIKRPKGWRGNKATSWLKPEQAFKLFAAADYIDSEFGLMCRILCYTGMRISEMLAVKLGDIDLDGRAIYLPKTKNNDARSVYLTAELVEALRAQPPRKSRPRSDGTLRLARGVAGRSRKDADVPFLERGDEARLFRFAQGGKLRQMLALAMRRAHLIFPVRQGGFHIFCHTYGSWMSRYGDLDTFALTRTERWKDPRSADRYRHTHVSEESRRADLLPTPQRIAENRGKSGEADTAPEKQKRKQRLA